MHVQTVCNKTNKNATLCSATTYAENVALPAFVRCMPAVQQSIDISYPPKHSSKHAAAACGDQMGQTDRQTDERTRRPTDA